MILALPDDVRERLAWIERSEGIPPLDLVHEAVRVWSALDEAERRILKLAAIDLMAGRARQ